MITLPEVTVVGTLTGDPELRFTPSGAAVANFSVACNDRRLNRDTGKWEDAGTTFLRCSIWRDYAEHVAESLSKGDRVVVIGRLRQREFEKDGEKRTVFELDAEEVTPSLRFATAKVQRVSRDGGSAGGKSGWRESGGKAPADDPWGGSEDPAPF